MGSQETVLHPSEDMAKHEKSPEDLEKTIKETMSRIKNKIVVMSGKGGVGKSTVAVNLAVGLAIRGRKVGLLDADIHGPNVPKMLGIEDAELVATDDGMVPVKAAMGIGVISMAFLLRDRDEPVIWRGPMKMAAIKQFLGDVTWGELDYLVIDLPPGTGDEPLSIAQLIPDGAWAIVVTTPQEVALLDSRKSVNFAKALKMKTMGIVENMSGYICPKCGENIAFFKVGGGEKAAKDFGVPFLGAIPMEQDVVLHGDDGKPIVLGKGSRSATALMKIVDMVINSVKEGN